MRTTARIVTGGIPQHVIIVGPDQETNRKYILHQCERNIGGTVFECYETTEWDLEQLSREPKLRTLAAFPNWYEMIVPYGWDSETGLSLC